MANSGEDVRKMILEVVFLPRISFAASIPFIKGIMMSKRITSGLFLPQYSISLSTLLIALIETGADISFDQIFTNSLVSLRHVSSSSQIIISNIAVSFVFYSYYFVILSLSHFNICQSCRRVDSPVLIISHI